MSDPTNPDDTKATDPKPKLGTKAKATDPKPKSGTKAELEAEVDRLRAELDARARGPVGDVEVVDDFEPPDVAVGDWVDIVHQDPLSGVPVDVARPAQVVRVVELESGPAVVVAYAAGGGVSDPVPLDHRLHGRVDAPRVVVGA